MNAQLQTITDTCASPRTTDVDPTTYLGLLTSDRARQILGALDDEPLTTAELADRTSIPLSTLYRQLSTMADALLLEESIRLQPGGHPTTQYARTTCEIVVSIADDITVSIQA